MIAKPENDKKARGSWRWPLILIGMLAAHAMFLICVAVLASNDRSFAIEPDYYGKAVAWDEQREQIRQNEQLGWKVKAEVGGPTGLFGDRLLRYEIVDASGATVVGATVEAEFFHHARGRERTQVSLPETAPGSYGLAVPMRKPGSWEVRLDVTRGDERFTHTEMLNVTRSTP